MKTLVELFRISTGKKRVSLAAIAILAGTCVMLGGCVTKPDGKKKFAPIESLKRADDSIESYYQRM